MLRDTIIPQTRSMFAYNHGGITPGAVMAAAAAVAIPLAIGFVTGRIVDSMIAAGGALTVGFGAFQTFSRYTAAPMGLALLGMMLASVNAALVTGNPVLVCIFAGLWGTVCGLVTGYGTGAWWIAAQAVVWFAISAAVPIASPPELVRRLGLIAAGGSLQLIVMCAYWIATRVPFRDVNAGPMPNPERGEQLRFCMANGLANLLAASAWKFAAVPNGYWVLVTAVLVMKPQFGETLIRGTARLAGTVVGAGAATLLAALLHPPPEALAIFAVFFAACTYALQRSGYAAFTTCLTVTVVCLISMTGAPEPEVAMHRVVATLLGGTLALAVSVSLGLLWRRPEA